MKGILKVYHPEETIKYDIKSSYCKAIYHNNETFLEVEIITNDDCESIEDDSLQCGFPQIAMSISDFPIADKNLAGKTIQVNDTDDETFCNVNLYNEEDAYIYDNRLEFSKDKDGNLQVIWSGEIDDFYTEGTNAIPFKLKCNFKQDEIIIDED